ncbi:hypothetical protein DQ244_15800 [Blastococcus sp. TBT05-19]|uniref:hypothetical protein n=1 Tax=Blastococcus sp. TBT05-19 TaxID=2250581 RepID=UPI000DEA54AF|nr:hypothetical protein [Blastococcus sp. TBT05-19]RBY88028.1 hypothetical protein DQ244_15800 [Blastococcus sp. TBT05-19]
MTRSPDDPQRDLTRALAGTGLLAGLALLTLPGAVTAAVAPRYPRERLWIARVLGARLIAQHALVLVAPEAAVVRIAAAVDGLHAASMLPVLALPRYRRAALVTGALAGAYALLGPAMAPSERR